MQPLLILCIIKYLLRIYRALLIPSAQHGCQDFRANEKKHIHDNLSSKKGGCQENKRERIGGKRGQKKHFHVPAKNHAYAKNC
jgi:hypothetical protein